jgi:hypothetical protein
MIIFRSRLCSREAFLLALNFACSMVSEKLRCFGFLNLVWGSAADVEGLLRVPGNTTVVKELYYGICRYGEDFLLKPKRSLPGYRPDPTLSGEEFTGEAPKQAAVEAISQGVRLGKNGLQVYDVFDVGSCVKLALKLLPETLLTNWIFDHFMAAQSKLHLIVFHF